ncbi:ATP-dependent zinc protease family protein [Pacificibacter marinus]|nr:RimK/LysX family protein [Pacificibacter marinus]
MNKTNKPKHDLMVIGWMEHLGLPALGLHRIKAKIDTGARTSALHATRIETFMQNDIEWVRFQVQMNAHAPELWVETPVHDRRPIKNTSGIPQERIIIRTKLQLKNRSWDISVSLADRKNMRFPLIIGRTALKHKNIAVHTRRANLTAG